MHYSKILLTTALLADGIAAKFCVFHCPVTEFSIWYQSNLTPDCNSKPTIKKNFVGTGLDGINGGCTTVGTQPFNLIRMGESSNIPPHGCRLKFYKDTICSQEILPSVDIKKSNPGDGDSGSSCFGFAGGRNVAARSLKLDCFP